MAATAVHSVDDVCNNKVLSCAVWFDKGSFDISKSTNADKTQTHMF